MNIPLFKVFMAPEAPSAVEKVLTSGFIGQGPVVEEFEQKLQAYLETPYALTLNSGTSALHLALHMLKAEHQTGEVLTTAFTCTATNFPIVANGFRIRWVDIDPTTLNMDLTDLERKLNPNVRAIIAMHWGGYPLDMDRLDDILTHYYHRTGHFIPAINDAAHAFGSRFKGKSLAQYGDMTMYSLQAIKHVTAVDGGVLAFSPYSGSEKLYRRAKLLRWYGIDRDEKGRTDFRCEADIPEWGFKFHMNDVNAAVGMANLEYANTIISSHQKNASFYDTELSYIPGVKLLTRHPNRESAFWIYSLIVENRPGFYRKMQECGITVSQVHERNDKHSAMKEFWSPLPELDRVVGSVVSIPVGWWVTPEQREYIVDCIKSGW